MWNQRSQMWRVSRKKVSSGITGPWSIQSIGSTMLHSGRWPLQLYGFKWLIMSSFIIFSPLPYLWRSKRINKVSPCTICGEANGLTVMMHVTTDVQVSYYAGLLTSCIVVYMVFAANDLEIDRFYEELSRGKGWQQSTTQILERSILSAMCGTM